MEVIATGKVTTFPGSSKYQIVIETLEPAGAGALMALLEERRRKLAAEGLFDAAAKKPLPFLPRVIGVVTSPTGAVIRDILHRIADRFPVHVLVWPVRVQGDGSGDEVANAIAGFNALGGSGGLPRPDVLIVARGGGSLEDLWGFNDEAVVRAAAASTIPLISAVGHETDWTLIDHAADRRAPTPTGAAEMAVPVKGRAGKRRCAALGARLQARGFARWRCAGRPCARLPARCPRSTSCSPCRAAASTRRRPGSGAGSRSIRSTSAAASSGWPAMCDRELLGDPAGAPPARVADAVTRVDRSTERLVTRLGTRLAGSAAALRAFLRRASKARSAASATACAGWAHAAKRRSQATSAGEATA